MRRRARCTACTTTRRASPSARSRCACPPRAGSASRTTASSGRARARRAPEAEHAPRESVRRPFLPGPPHVGFHGLDRRAAARALGRRADSALPPLRQRRFARRAARRDAPDPRPPHAFLARRLLLPGAVVPEVVAALPAHGGAARTLRAHLRRRARGQAARADHAARHRLSAPRGGGPERHARGPARARGRATAAARARRRGARRRTMSHAPRRCTAPGFTLVELAIAVAMLVVLGVLTFTQYLAYIERLREA